LIESGIFQHQKPYYMRLLLFYQFKSFRPMEGQTLPFTLGAAMGGILLPACDNVIV
jgi:hypothetical protein